MRPPGPGQFTATTTILHKCIFIVAFHFDTFFCDHDDGCIGDGDGDVNHECGNGVMMMMMMMMMVLCRGGGGGGN